ncbi:hypothetical protein DFH08DRAFT_826211 [Mycena albidolilacea]|uniref:Uncharacterized protein n=1 Tax=Mycena albidolilacea TaxID=1033008 RepID=A0AAD7E8M5_9AGAR|nr:hypothetical protein DFH08DRAFT_826211 [Mycena albidolilacea]
MVELAQRWDRIWTGYNTAAPTAPWTRSRKRTVSEVSESETLDSPVKKAAKKKPGPKPRPHPISSVAPLKKPKKKAVLKNFESSKCRTSIYGISYSPTSDSDSKSHSSPGLARDISVQGKLWSSSQPTSDSDSESRSSPGLARDISIPNFRMQRMIKKVWGKMAKKSVVYINNEMPEMNTSGICLTLALEWMVQLIVGGKEALAVECDQSSWVTGIEGFQSISPLQLYTLACAFSTGWDPELMFLGRHQYGTVRGDGAASNQAYHPTTAIKFYG